MYKLFVYLILDECRLIITEIENKDENYFLVMRTTGPYKEMLYTSCNTFCIGYIKGNFQHRKITNDPLEFKNKLTHINK